MTQEIPRRAAREAYAKLRELPREELEAILEKPAMPAGSYYALERIYRERRWPFPGYEGTVEAEGPTKRVIDPSELSSLQAERPDRMSPWRPIAAIAAGFAMAALTGAGKPGLGILSGMVACGLVWFFWGVVERGRRERR